MASYRYPPELREAFKKNGIINNKLEELKAMTTKQLIDYVIIEFDVILCNAYGHNWLLRKAMYMEVDRLRGLSEKAQRNNKALDNPLTLEALAEAELIRKEQQAMNTTTKTTEKKINKKAIATDKYGFRTNSKGSLMFAALIKGCTRDELSKIGGSAMAGFLAGIRKDPRDWPAGRKVVYVGGDKMKIASYTDKGGKTHELCKVNKPKGDGKKKTTKTATKAKAKKKTTKVKAKSKGATARA